MLSGPEPVLLPLAADWLVLKDAVKRFEHAWRQGPRPTIDDYLPTGEPLRARVLLELVHIDLELRLKAGEAARVEEYLTRYPYLTDDRHVTLGLIAVERELRRRREPNLALDDFLQRFPQYQAELPAQFALPNGDTVDVQPPPAEWRMEAPPEVAGYEVLALLGRGGMGVVYKARQLRLNRVVALKMILAGYHATSEQVIRFGVEAKTVAQLAHPNIVQIHEVGSCAGRPWLALEYVGGGSLADKLAGRPQPSRECAALVEVLARAMHHAHQHGIVHRDLKPANVLLTEEGTLKVVDFGLARLVHVDLGLTAPDVVLGTPAYMAPEQLHRPQAAGPTADIYALGVILYEALTGRPPFGGAAVAEVFRQVAEQEPVPPSRLAAGVPRDLETICLKCLDKEPRKRYTTAEDLADDLRRYQEGAVIAARPASPGERCVKWVRRRPTLAGLIVCSVLLVVGAFAWIVGQWRQAEAAHQAAIEHRKQEKLLEAAKFMQLMTQIRALYASAIVAQVEPEGIAILADYRNQPGAIPVWATFVHELSDRLEQQEGRQYTRLYSDYPFPRRPNGGPRDDFERQALAHLRRQPEQPFYRFEAFAGRPTLRYATADVMHQACLACHNRQPESPKTDWKVGDVRGVLEVILPLE